MTWQKPSIAKRSYGKVKVSGVSVQVSALIALKLACASAKHFNDLTPDTRNLTPDYFMTLTIGHRRKDLGHVV